MPSTDPISLTRHLLEEQRAGHISPDLRLLMEVVALADRDRDSLAGAGDDFHQ